MLIAYLQDIGINQNMDDIFLEKNHVVIVELAFVNNQTMQSGLFLGAIPPIMTPEDQEKHILEMCS